MTEMILPSSVLILAVILLRRALRGRIAPGLQYALWLLAALRLLIPGPLVPAPVSAAGENGAAPRMRWRGRLLAVDAEGFSLEPCALSPEGEVRPEGQPPVRLPWSEVRRAARIPVFQKPVKPGKGRGRHPSQACRARAAAGGRHES